MTNIVYGGLKDWPDLFKARKLHVVCVAAGGLTVCDFAASTLGGMKQEEEVWPLTKKVNLLGETGTFWPRLPLTVVPQPYDEGRPVPPDLNEFFRASFLDAAKANRDYIKLDTMFVDLNGYYRAPHGESRLILEENLYFSRPLRIAEAILSSEQIIKNIYFAERLT